jgi:hypothetical protein
VGRSALLAALLLLVASVAGGTGVPPVEVVQVTANTGLAAGGHVALRIDEHAYHWEVHEDGFLALAREEWRVFALRYGTLENRGMRLVRLDLAAEQRIRLQEALLRFWRAQQQDLAHLESLSLERRWHRHLEGADPPKLAGAGFFDDALPCEPSAAALRERVVRQLGPGALIDERTRVEARIATAMGEDLRDALLLREALIVLLESRGLAAAALVDPAAELAEVGDLSTRERERLTDLAATLERSVVQLVRSPRPDRGRPLMLALARHQAVVRSLEHGRFLLLDAIPDQRVILDPETIALHRDLVSELATRAAQGWRWERRALGSAPLDEATYNRFEEAATGVYETTAALDRGQPLRARPLGRLIPNRPGAVDPMRSPRPLEGRAADAAAREEHFRAELSERYAYDLLRHNCATEIEAVLAGATGFDAGPLAFIPAGLARDVAASDLAQEAVEFPSHRRRRVAELARQEGRLRVALRESNTWTSTVYQGSITDDAFLFFGDGTPWMRPLLGTANLVYGLGQATVGLATAPFDRGRRAWGGLRGAFYSVPEMVGFSIRKGRYDLLPRSVSQDSGAESLQLRRP